jgi:hypothetical protein
MRVPVLHHQVHVYGFDERQYAEAVSTILIFKMDCTMPTAWIPGNQTSYLKWLQIPSVMRSKGFQQQAISEVECERPIPT